MPVFKQEQKQKDIHKIEVINESGLDSVADEWRASFFGRLTFGWLTPLVVLGNKKSLEFSDIGGLDSGDYVKQHFQIFQENLKKGNEKTFRSDVWKSFSKLEWKAVACKFTSDALQYVSPFCINAIIRFVEDGNSQDTDIFWICGLALLTPMLIGFCNHWSVSQLAPNPQLPHTHSFCC